MNSTLKSILENESPKIVNIDEKESNLYKMALGVLARLVPEDFLDLPRLSEDRFSKVGLFYEIPYYDSTQLYANNNQRTLLVVYHVTDEFNSRTLFCPFRLDFKFVKNEDNPLNSEFAIIIYNSQTNESRHNKKFVERKSDGSWYSEIKGFETMKLSDLLSL